MSQVTYGPNSGPSSRCKAFSTRSVMISGSYPLFTGSALPYLQQAPFPKFPLDWSCIVRPFKLALFMVFRASPLYSAISDYNHGKYTIITCLITINAERAFGDMADYLLMITVCGTAF